MGEGIYYIVTEGGAPAVENAPATGEKVAVVCERPDLAEEGETLEPINPGNLALLLDARTDVDHVRIGAPEGPTRTIDKSEFPGDAVS